MGYELEMEESESMSQQEIKTNTCDKCKCEIHWDALKQAPNGTKRAKEGKLGWWVETLSKELHNLDRCKKLQTTGEFRQPEKEFVPEFVTKEEGILWNDIVAKCCEYKILALKKIKEYPEIDQNPASTGQIFGIASDVLKHIKERMAQSKEFTGLTQ